MKNSIYALFTLMVLIGCQPKEQLPIIQKIDSDWSFKSKNATDWHAATVPGNVFTDLLDHNLIENPFIKTNEEKVQWVSDSSWVYKTTFKVDKKTLQRKHIELNFEGLDTYAKIYLNDSLILSSKNAFRQYLIPVKSILKERNELQIEFESTRIQEEKEKNRLSYKLPEGNRIFTRKAQFQYGWDWGPKLNTAGIWKDIYLRAWDDYKIRDVIIHQKDVNSSVALLLIEIKKKSSVEINKKLVYDIYINDGLVKSSNVIYKGYTWIEEIKIKNPKLWWPHNLGEPYLYDIKIVVKNDTEILDTYFQKLGLRTIKLVTKKDTIGESFYFKVNDVPVYMKGANYIPQNSFQNKVTPEHYQNLLNDVVDGNMNMLRVWGGGIYENDIFYDLCDKKGILVWQDFMFACAMYPGDKSYLENVQQEASSQVKRLRNHASIALWAGNNENSEGWHRWGWQNGRSEKEKKEIWKSYLNIFDSILPITVKKLSQTSYWESSPRYGRGNPKYKTEGDAHDWWVWHDGYPFEHFEENVPRFMSEFGFQSFPSYETINYINQKDSVDIHTEAIKSHQKHTRGFQLIDTYMKRDYPVPTSDEDYVYISQLLQAKGITMGIEAQRRAKPYNMGSLFWQLNDCWPAISWSSIDYFGNWKALHYKAKKSFANVLISTEKTKYDYDTYIINDSLVDLKGTLKLKIIDFYGKEIWSNSKEIIVKANTSQKVYHIPQVNIYEAGYVYIIEFNNATSYYYFTKPKSLILPKGNIKKEIKKVKNGFSIILKSTVLQKDVFLSTESKGHFSDNYFDLLPNHTTKIFFRTNATSIEDLKVKRLNQLIP
ncbi:MAG: glycoside hydrolase family 2 protein [Flavobacteriaceae bacterium]